MAPTEMAVERKIVWGKWFETSATTIAGKMLAVSHDFPVLFCHVLNRLDDVNNTFADRKCTFDAVRDSRTSLFLDLDPVDHDLNIVPRPS